MIFYKKRLVPTESGLEIITDKFISIHETPCFHFCVSEWSKGDLPAIKREGESELAAAKRFKILKRISKDSSRFAFDTEEKALEHLRFLKRKQLGHMKRDIKFIEAFLKTEELENNLVPKSHALVHDYYHFD